MQESKEKIRNRMIRNASRMWGYPDTQADSSFDPVVALILGALAGELAHISAEINSVESRILEKLVELLTPEPITGPFPAHAIARAKAAESSTIINPGFQLYLNKRYLIPGEHKADEKPVFFTPTGSYRIFNGEIKYMVSNSRIFEIQEELQKEILTISHKGPNRTTTELWFGIQLDKGVDALTDLSFCFDLRNEVFEDSFYDSLSKGKWSINNRKAIFTQGLKDKKPYKQEGESFMEVELDVTTKVIRHINRFYESRFQTLSSDNFKLNDSKDTNGLPAELYNYFSGSELEKLQKDLVWVNVQFPQVVPSDVIDDLFVSINCFPVFNRHLIEFTQSAREYVNIVPLFTEEVFFDIRRITTGNGRSFTQKSFSGIKEIETGTYILRNGGVGRFDSRNAAEIISYLLELLRDESAAFSIIGADMITSELRELNQTITRLDYRLSESNVARKNVPYVLLKASSEDDTLFVEFWTTNGEFGNKIKSGEKLFLYDGSGVWPDSVVLVTPTVGGRESLDTEERVNAYRKALLSHGRVVTREDVKALCFEHFGKELNSVEVKKGVEIGKATNNGFSQTLDIFIRLNKPLDEYDSEELNFLKKDLLTKIKEQSVNILPYRCFYLSNRNK